MVRTRAAKAVYGYHSELTMERAKAARSASGSAARMAGIEPPVSLTDFKRPRMAKPLIRAMSAGPCPVDLHRQVAQAPVHRLHPVRHTGPDGDEVAGGDGELGTAADRRGTMLAGRGHGRVHEGAARDQGGASREHVPHVRVALVHLGRA